MNIMVPFQSVAFHFDGFKRAFKQGLISNAELCPHFSLRTSKEIIEQNDEMLQEILAEKPQAKFNNDGPNAASAYASPKSQKGD